MSNSPLRANVIANFRKHLGQFQRKDPKVREFQKLTPEMVYDLLANCGYSCRADARDLLCQMSVEEWTIKSAPKTGGFDMSSPLHITLDVPLDNSEPAYHLNCKETNKGLVIIAVKQYLVDEHSPDAVLVKVPAVRALMDVIAFAEGADYSTMVKGKGSFKITDFSKHPHVVVEVNSKLKSTAAGRYQILYKTWTELRLPDFSPASQDLAAVKLFKRRRMLRPLFARDVKLAIRRGNHEWASLPDSPYGQPTHSMAELLVLFYKKRKEYLKLEAAEWE